MFTIEQQKMIMKNIFNKDEEETTKTKCLHDSCPQCGGTGVKKTEQVCVSTEFHARAINARLNADNNKTLLCRVFW